MSERTSHFREGYAKMLFEDLYPMFSNLFIEEADMEYKKRHLEAEQTRQDIQDYLAERAYDIALHTVYNVSSRDLVTLLMRECVLRVPDITDWSQLDN